MTKHIAEPLSASQIQDALGITDSEKDEARASLRDTMVMRKVERVILIEPGSKWVITVPDDLPTDAILRAENQLREFMEDPETTFLIVPERFRLVKVSKDVDDEPEPKPKSKPWDWLRKRLPR